MIKRIGSYSFKPVVGLEIHAQIISNTKLFSGAGTSPFAASNSLVAPFDQAIPGTLPSLNRSCVIKAVQASYALNCKINRVSYFERKHYEYADLPNNYQITQSTVPLAIDGFLKFPICSQTTYWYSQARVKQIQLEQDSGKLLNDENFTYVDLNRAGVALIEIVTRPDFNSGTDASWFVREVASILRHINVCSGRFGEGAMRVDASVSLNDPDVKGTDENYPGGTIVELKNLGSVRNLHLAIDSEIVRQYNCIANGISISNETRSFDIEKKRTVSSRDKSRFHDYRIFPDSNIPPLVLFNSKAETNDCRAVLLEELDIFRYDIHDQLRSLALSNTSMLFLLNSPEYIHLFFKCLKTDKVINNDTLASNVLNLIKHYSREKKAPPISINNIVEIENFISNGILASQYIESLIEKLFDKDSRPVAEIIKSESYYSEFTDDDLKQVVLKIIDENPKDFDLLLAGKKSGMRRLMGKVRRQTNNKADLTKVHTLIKRICNVN